MVKTDVTTLQFFSLALAMLIYALSGSPTPDIPGATEGVIAALLMLAAGLPGFYGALQRQGPEPLWRWAGRILLLYGFSAALIAGVSAGHDIHYIVRDIVPFLFLLLPLFLAGIFERHPELKTPFIKLIVFTGLVFAMRGAPEIVGWWNNDYKGELYYFANAPSLLFAALFLVGTGAQNFVRKITLGSAILCLICFALALLPLSAIVFTLQRASAGVFAAGLLTLFAAAFYRYPRRAIFLLLLTALCAFPFFQTIADLGGLFLRKTGAVGFNMRGEELAAAWREISTSPLSAFFGTGWGGTFESPAVAGIRVNYTHSLLSAMLLKTGLTGLTLTAAYLLGLAHLLIGEIRRNIVLVVALAGPLAIDIFLYASYKSLDFGLLLLLAAILPAAARVAPERRVLYSNLYTRLSYE